MNLIVTEKAGPHGQLIIVTDEDILGKVFSEGRLQLDLSKDFYQGEKMTEEAIKELFHRARHIHLTGKDAVDLGVRLGLVEEKKILFVEGIPHAEVLIES